MSSSKPNIGNYIHPNLLSTPTLNAVEANLDDVPTTPNLLSPVVPRSSQQQQHHHHHQQQQQQHQQNQQQHQQQQQQHNTTSNGTQQHNITAKHNDDDMFFTPEPFHEAIAQVDAESGVAVVGDINNVTNVPPQQSKAHCTPNHHHHHQNPLKKHSFTKDHLTIHNNYNIYGYPRDMIINQLKDSPYNCYTPTGLPKALNKLNFIKNDQNDSKNDQNDQHSLNFIKNASKNDKNDENGTKNAQNTLNNTTNPHNQPEKIDLSPFCDPLLTYVLMHSALNPKLVRKIDFFDKISLSARDIVDFCLDFLSFHYKVTKKLYPTLYGTVYRVGKGGDDEDDDKNDEKNEKNPQNDEKNEKNRKKNEKFHFTSEKTPKSFEDNKGQMKMLAILGFSHENRVFNILKYRFAQLLLDKKMMELPKSSQLNGESSLDQLLLDKKMMVLPKSSQLDGKLSYGGQNGPETSQLDGKLSDNQQNCPETPQGCTGTPQDEQNLIRTSPNQQNLTTTSPNQQNLTVTSQNQQNCPENPLNTNLFVDINGHNLTTVLSEGSTDDILDFFDTEYDLDKKKKAQNGQNMGQNGQNDQNGQNMGQNGQNKTQNRLTPTFFTDGLNATMTSLSRGDYLVVQAPFSVPLRPVISHLDYLASSERHKVLKKRQNDSKSAPNGQKVPQNGQNGQKTPQNDQNDENFNNFDDFSYFYGDYVAQGQIVQDLLGVKSLSLDTKIMTGLCSGLEEPKYTLHNMPVVKRKERVKNGDQNGWVGQNGQNDQKNDETVQKMTKDGQNMAKNDDGIGQNGQNMTKNDENGQPMTNNHGQVVDITLRGVIDFMVRNDAFDNKKSPLFHTYDLWDTKLHGNPETKDILQVMLYAYALNTEMVKRFGQEGPNGQDGSGEIDFLTCQLNQTKKDEEDFFSTTKSTTQDETSPTPKSLKISPIQRPAIITHIAIICNSGSITRIPLDCLLGPDKVRIEMETNPDGNYNTLCLKTLHSLTTYISSTYHPLIIPDTLVKRIASGDIGIQKQFGNGAFSEILMNLYKNSSSPSQMYFLHYTHKAKLLAPADIADHEYRRYMQELNKVGLCHGEVIEYQQQQESVKNDQNLSQNDEKMIKKQENGQNLPQNDEKMIKKLLSLKKLKINPPTPTEFLQSYSLYSFAYNIIAGNHSVLDQLAFIPTIDGGKAFLNTPLPSTIDDGKAFLNTRLHSQPMVDGAKAFLNSIIGGGLSTPFNTTIGDETTPFQTSSQANTTSTQIPYKIDNTDTSNQFTIDGYCTMTFRTWLELLLSTTKDITQSFALLSTATTNDITQSFTTSHPQQQHQNNSSPLLTINSPQSSSSSSSPLLVINSPQSSLSSFVSEDLYKYNHFDQLKWLPPTPLALSITSLHKDLSLYPIPLSSTSSPPYPIPLSSTSSPPYPTTLSSTSSLPYPTPISSTSSPSYPIPLSSSDSNIMDNSDQGNKNPNIIELPEQITNQRVSEILIIFLSEWGQLITQFLLSFPSFTTTTTRASPSSSFGSFPSLNTTSTTTPTSSSLTATTTSTSSSLTTTTTTTPTSSSLTTTTNTWNKNDVMRFNKLEKGIQKVLSLRLFEQAFTFIKPPTIPSISSDLSTRLLSPKASTLDWLQQSLAYYLSINNHKVIGDKKDSMGNDKKNNNKNNYDDDENDDEIFEKITKNQEKITKNEEIFEKTKKNLDCDVFLDLEGAPMIDNVITLQPYTISDDELLRLFDSGFNDVDGMKALMNVSPQTQKNNKQLPFTDVNDTNALINVSPQTQNNKNLMNVSPQKNNKKTPQQDPQSIFLHSIFNGYNEYLTKSTLLNGVKALGAPKHMTKANNLYYLFGFTYTCSVEQFILINTKLHYLNSINNPEILSIGVDSGVGLDDGMDQVKGTNGLDCLGHLDGLDQNIDQNGMKNDLNQTKNGMKNALGQTRNDMKNGKDQKSNVKIDLNQTTNELSVTHTITTSSLKQNITFTSNSNSTTTSNLSRNTTHPTPYQHVGGFNNQRDIKDQHVKFIDGANTQQTEVNNQQTKVKNQNVKFFDVQGDDYNYISKLSTLYTALQNTIPHNSSQSDVLFTSTNWDGLSCGDGEDGVGKNKKIIIKNQTQIDHEKNTTNHQKTDEIKNQSQIDKKTDEIKNQTILKNQSQIDPKTTFVTVFVDLWAQSPDEEIQCVKVLCNFFEALYSIQRGDVVVPQSTTTTTITNTTNTTGLLSNNDNVFTDVIVPQSTTTTTTTTGLIKNGGSIQRGDVVVPQSTTTTNTTTTGLLSNNDNVSTKSPSSISTQSPSSISTQNPSSISPQNPSSISPQNPSLISTKRPFNIYHYHTYERTALHAVFGQFLTKYCNEYNENEELELDMINSEGGDSDGWEDENDFEWQKLFKNNDKNDKKNEKFTKKAEKTQKIDKKVEKSEIDRVLDLPLTKQMQQFCPHTNIESLLPSNQWGKQKKVVVKKGVGEVILNNNYGNCVDVLELVKKLIRTNKGSLSLKKVEQLVLVTMKNNVQWDELVHDVEEYWDVVRIKENEENEQKQQKNTIRIKENDESLSSSESTTSTIAPSDSTTSKPSTGRTTMIKEGGSSVVQYMIWRYNNLIKGHDLLKKTPLPSFSSQSLSTYHSSTWSLYNDEDEDCVEGNENGENEEKEQNLLWHLRQYNRDDCYHTQIFVYWLFDLHEQLRKVNG